MTKLYTAECRQFIEAVSHEANAMGVPVAVALVNAEGHLIALERMDDAGFITAEIAHAKAYTMAAFRSMSPRFPDGLVIQHWFKERNPQMMINASVFTNGKIVASGGTHPVFKGDELVGAFGISGGTSNQDEEIAQRVLSQIGWRTYPEHDTTPADVKAHVNEIYRAIGLGERGV